jgi:hypothetical protein
LLDDSLNTLPISVNDINTAPDDSVMSRTDTLVSLDDYKRTLARVGEERDALQAALEKTQKRVRTIEILDELIEPMAKRAFGFMCTYCGVVAAMLFLHGYANSGFKLPSEVLQFLVGSTATTVIGLVGMVLTGVFVGARNKNGS